MSAATPFPIPVKTDAEAAVQQVLACLRDRPGALLPILHAVQDMLGYVPPHAVPQIADALNLSRAEVHGVISYYHHFRTQPAAPHTLQVCRAEACQAMGGEALLAHARAHLHCGTHHTSGDGRFTVEPAYCLGLCASSPAVMLDGQVHARVSPQRLEALVAQARQPQMAKELA